MAESAVILNPNKKVVIPDKNALCPMAVMLPAEDVKLARRKHRDAAVVPKQIVKRARKAVKKMTEITGR